MIKWERIELDQLGTMVASVSSRLLRADGAALLLWDEGRRYLELLGHSDPRWVPRSPVRIPPGHGATGAAFEAERAVVVHDYPRSRHAAETGNAYAVKSALAAPILVGERRVGVLSAWSYTSAGWTPEHPRLLCLINTVIGTPVVNAQHRARSAAVRLTPREAQVLGDMMAGVPARSIAQRERLSEATVRTHIRSLLTKLGASSQLAAVARARQLGLGPY